jgi:quercetin dioxygenase-like cupin family protein
MSTPGENASRQPQPFHSRNTTAPAFWSMDILWTMLATSDQTAGQYTVIEELCPKDSGPPPHIHEWQDEAIYLIEGEITFRAGDQTIHAQAGSFVSIPRGTTHSFRVESETARILNFYAPADLDRVIMMTGTPAQSRTLPPRGLPMQNDPQQQQELARRLLDLASQTFVDTPDTLRS